MMEMKWIPVCDRLPVNGYNVLISTKNYTAEGCLEHDGDWTQFRWSATIPNEEVVAWMPMPEPFEASEDVGEIDFDRFLKVLKDLEEWVEP